MYSHPNIDMPRMGRLSLANTLDSCDQTNNLKKKNPEKKSFKLHY